MRLSLKTFNAELAKRGFDVQLAKGEGMEMAKNNGQRLLCARAIEVGELEMVVEAERRVPVGNIVALRTAESGFVGRARVQSWEPNGFDYRMSLRMLDSHTREL